MPNTTLYSILTTEGSAASSYMVDSTMQILGRQLQDAGIPKTVANAMAGVVGRNSEFEWMLVSASRNPDIPSTGSAYRWDDKDRYFFKYENKTDPNSYAVMLEYTRFNSPFELRGVAIKDGIVSDAKISDQKVREAIIAMLFCILWSEEVTGYAMCANSFRRSYNSMFSDDQSGAAELIKNLFDTLKAHVDPRQSEAAAPFELDNACLNQKNSKLKQILEGENTAGYLNQNNCKICLAADAKIKPLAQSGDVTDEAAIFVEILTGLLSPLRAQRVERLNPNMYPVCADRVYAEDEKNRLLEIPDWYIPVQRIVRFASRVAILLKQRKESFTWPIIS